MAPAIAAALITAAAAVAEKGIDTYTANKQTEAQEKLAKEKTKRIQNALSESNATYDEILKQLENYKKGQNTFSSPEMVSDYKDLLASYNPEDYVYDFDKFSFDKSVNDYMNPYYDKIIADTTNKIQNTAAGAGLGRSGGTAFDIAEGVAQKEDELYKTALNEYNTDKNFAYQEYSDYITNMQNKYNTMANLTSNKINLMSGAISHDEQQQSDYMSDLLSVMQDKASNNVNASLYT